jgi:hypothetical protein
LVTGLIAIKPFAKLVDWLDRADATEITMRTADEHRGVGRLVVDCQGSGTQSATW